MKQQIIHEPLWLAVQKMNLRDAIHILMLSPIYFYLPVPQRLLLAKEYCQTVNSIVVSSAVRL